MAYTIYHADGTPVNVPDNAIDNEFYNSNANGVGKGIGTQLVGRNAINYGTPVAQNFLQLTENFAGTNIPQDAYALQGQLWFEKDSAHPTTTGKLHVRVTNLTTGGSANWNKLVAEDTSGNVTITHDVTAVTFLGNLTGDVTGNVTGNLTGNVTGGNISGNGSGLTDIPVSAIVGLKNWAVVNPTVGSEKTGDINVNGAVISIYAAGAWKQVFPAVYS